MLNNIKNNLEMVQEDIAPYTPNIIAVTKYYGIEAIIEGYKAGLRNFAESRAVEAVEKIKNLPEEIKENSQFHFIGHLQSNKVNKVVEYFDFIHSVDSLKLAETISEVAIKLNKTQQILLQLNNANEEQKFGFSKEALFENFKEINSLKGLKVVGLMNIAPLTNSTIMLGKLFFEVKKIRDDLETEFDCELKELSMGMSNDYRIAVANGATMIRLGRRIFS